MTLIATPRPDGHPDILTRPLTTTSERMREAWRWTDMAVVERHQANAALRAYRAGDAEALGDYQAALSRSMRYRRRAAEVRATPVEGNAA